jgi:DNA-binding transcriptional MerR regulator
MGRRGLLIGQVAKLSGATRKALRPYEEADILTAPPRTAAGYRVYGAETLGVLAFVGRAQGLRFTLDEIKRSSSSSGRVAHRARSASVWLQVERMNQISSGKQRETESGTPQIDIMTGAVFESPMHPRKQVEGF